MGHVQENAAESGRRVLTALRDGEFSYELDNGARVAVAVRVNREDRTAEIDFTGTSPQLAGNFNAPSSVAMAAVLYVFRTLVDDDIPLNSGCLHPLKVIIPPGNMLPARRGWDVSRRRSGGEGRGRGGRGGVWGLRFGEPRTVSTLAGHGRVPAFGLAGGEPGALGRHWIEHADGTVTAMAGCDSVDVR